METGRLTASVRGRRLLFVTTEPLPPPYHSLRELYGRILPSQGIKVGWVGTASPGLLHVPDDWSPPGQTWRLPSQRGVGGMAMFGGHVARSRQTAALRRSVAHGDWDIVQVRDDPWLGRLFADASKASGTPFIYQLSHLKEEETLLHARRGWYGNRATNSIKALVALALRHQVLQRASLTMTISDAMAAYIARGGLLRLSRPTGAIDVLPEGAPTHLTELTIDRAVARRRLGLGDGPVLIYLGTLARIRELDILFPVVRILRRQYPTLTLLMVGEGNIVGDRQFLEMRARAEQVIENVRFIGAVPLDATPDFIAAADVGLSPLPPNMVLWHNSPIKLFEYLAMGVPVVGSAIPEQETVLAESGAGFAVDHTVDAFVTAINDILSHPAEARRRGAAGRSYIRSHRTFDVLAGRLTRAIDRLVPTSAHV